MDHPGTRLCTTLLFVLAVASNSPVSHSAASESETEHATRIDSVATYIDRSYGFSIKLARDFHLSSEEQDVLFFRSRERKGTVIIRPRPGLSVSSIQAAMRNGFDSEAIKLTPTGPPVTLNLSNGQGLSREVGGTINGVEVQGTLAGVIGGNQQGYMILVGTIKGSWVGFKTSALAMLNSLTIRPVEFGYAHERWQKRLQVYRLVFVQGYGSYIWGGAQVSEYHFCSDGTFRQRTDTTNTYSTGLRRSTYGTTSKGKGTWGIQLVQNDPYLKIVTKNGSQATFPVADREGYIFLGDIPYQLAQNQLCQ
ncbi:MAG TPA: hypothetical protein EYG51_16035 [Pseudomonadales bacterium]|nr:hypothetical protein [Pseudomonadales bacterium]